MDSQIVAVFCLVDDILKAMSHREDEQCQMSDAEVMTTAILAALYFGGNYTLARRMLVSQGYILRMLSKSRFSRRLHRIKPFFETLFGLLGEYWKALNANSIYAVDTFPIPVCDNYRIKRARLYQGERYRGYIASKKRYFFGIKLHLMVTEAGQPVELLLSPGSFFDGLGLYAFDFDLPEGSQVVGDKAYNNYAVEDLMATAGIQLSPFRKKNSKRPNPPWVRYLQFHYRKMVETTGSLLCNLLPKKIHATSALGFELKIILFVLACSLNYLFKVAT
jgi:Transposase DDE domain